MDFSKRATRMTRHSQRRRFIKFAIIVLISIGTAVVAASPQTSAQTQNWANWRGPEQNSISRETGLVNEWSWEPKKNGRLVG